MLLQAHALRRCCDWQEIQRLVSEWGVDPAGLCDEISREQVCWDEDGDRDGLGRVGGVGLGGVVGYGGVGGMAGVHGVHGVVGVGGYACVSARLRDGVVQRVHGCKHSPERATVRVQACACMRVHARARAPA